MEAAEKAREAVSKGDSALWAEDTRFTTEELEGLYVDHVVCRLEADKDPLNFIEFCETELAISD